MSIEIAGSHWEKTVTGWEDWERIHAEQDARDRKIIIAVLTLIAVLALVTSLTASW